MINFLLFTGLWLSIGLAAGFAFGFLTMRKDE